MAKVNLINLPDDNPLFDLQLTIYSSKNYTRRSLHHSRFVWVVNAIQNYSSDISFSEAVEYGPGSGIYLPILAKYFSRVVGADVEAAYMSGIQASIKSVKNLRLVVDSIQNSSFLNESFDFVLCSEVLEHVSQPEFALKNMYRILKPGGVLILTTPQRYSLMELFCKIAFLPGVINFVRYIYQEPILESGHISLQTYAKLNSMINQAGFEVLEHNKFGLYIPLVAEFGGVVGGQFLEYLGNALHRTPLRWMLWTQAFVLRKPF